MTVVYPVPQAVGDPATVNPYTLPRTFLLPPPGVESAQSFALLHQSPFVLQLVRKEGQAEGLMHNLPHNPQPGRKDAEGEGLVAGAPFLPQAGIKDTGAEGLMSGYGYSPQESNKVGLASPLIHGSGSNPQGSNKVGLGGSPVAAYGALLADILKTGLQASPAHGYGSVLQLGRKQGLTFGLKHGYGWLESDSAAGEVASSFGLVFSHPFMLSAGFKTGLKEGYPEHHEGPLTTNNNLSFPDNRAGQSFVVPTGETWTIKAIWFSGRSRIILEPDGDVRFAVHSNASGTHGTDAEPQDPPLRETVSVAANTLEDPTNWVRLALTSPLTLTAGTYHVVFDWFNATEGQVAVAANNTTEHPGNSSINLGAGWSTGSADDRMFRVEAFSHLTASGSLLAEVLKTGLGSGLVHNYGSVLQHGRKQGLTFGLDHGYGWLQVASEVGEVAQSFGLVHGYAYMTQLGNKVGVGASPVADYGYMLQEGMKTGLKGGFYDLYEQSHFTVLNNMTSAAHRAQSFVVPAGETVVIRALWFSIRQGTGSPNGDVVYALHSNDSGTHGVDAVPAEPEIALTGAIAASSLATAGVGDWVRLAFSTPVVLTAGTYHSAIHRTGASQGAIQVAGDNTPEHHGNNSSGSGAIWGSEPGQDQIFRVEDDQDSLVGSGWLPQGGIKVGQHQILIAGYGWLQTNSTTGIQVILPVETPLGLVAPAVDTTIPELHLGPLDNEQDQFLAFQEIERLFNEAAARVNEEPWVAAMITVLMKLIDASGVARTSDAIELLPIFNVDQPDTNWRLIMRATNDIGLVANDFSIDATQGGAHKVQLGDDVSLSSISNLVGPEPMSLYVDLQGLHTLTLNSTFFKGPKLSFTGTGAFISFVDFGGGVVGAMGNDY